MLDEVVKWMARGVYIYGFAILLVSAVVAGPSLTDLVGRQLSLAIQGEILLVLAATLRIVWRR